MAEAGATNEHQAVEALPSRSSGAVAGARPGSPRSSPQPPPPTTGPLNELLRQEPMVEALAALLRDLPSLTRRSRVSEAQVAVRTLYVGGLGALVMIALIIGGTVGLALAGRLDGTSVTFVFGTVLGALVTFASAPWLFMLATLLAFSVGLSSVFLQGGGLGVAPLLPAIGGGAAVVSVLALTISCVPIVRLRRAVRRGAAASLDSSPPESAAPPAAGSLRTVGAQMSRVATWSGQAAPR